MNNTLSFTQLAEQFDTPLYIYDQQQLQTRLRRFQSDLTYRPLHLHVALMANDTPALLQLCRSEGVGAFVNAPRHLSLALHQVGWSPEKIIYASSNTRETVIQAIARLGVTFHANSLRELALFGHYAPGSRVGIRLAWPLPGGSRPGRLGLRRHELAEALHLARRHGLQITGLHLYLGTNLDRASYYHTQLKKILQWTGRFPNLAYLDLSGGFSVGPQAEFDFKHLNRGLAEILAAYEQDTGRHLGLVLEPGRAAFAQAGYFLTRVVEVHQETERRMIGVDGSLSLLPLLILHPGGQPHPVTVVGTDEPALSKPATICGASTYSRDYLARNIHLPPVKPGDLLVFANAGAYSYACLSNYLGIARPAQVLVNEQEITLITPREKLIL